MHPLEKMFRPRSIAVVGASGDPEKLGGRTLLHLKELGYQGRIYPINVSATEVQGLPAWPSVADLPETPDSALILLPAKHVAKAIDDCAAKGVKHVQVLSSGFAEEGGEGVAMQAALAEQARAHGIRLTGPNCLGSISPPDGFFGTFSSLLATAKPPPGSVGVATQSGAYGSHIYAVAGFRGIGISRAIATGNEVDIDVAEAIDYLVEDPGTRVICASLEGCSNGEGLRRALLKAAASRKPVIIMKVGSTEVGAAAAATHTGSLAGEDRVIDAVFRECGALRVSSIEEMLDVAYVCSIAPLPPVASAGIVSVSGGIGVLMADACIEAGLSVPPLATEALDAVRAVQPMAGGRNPIDTTAQLAGRLHVIETISQSMMGGADLGAIFFYLAHLGRDLRRFPKIEGAFLALRRNQPDRTVVAVMTHIDEVRQQLEAQGVPVFEDPTRAVRAVAGASGLRRLQTEAQPIPDVEQAEPLGLGIANEAQAKALIAAAGLPVLPEHACTTADDAAAVADRLGYPVVMKILSDDIPHKTEIGGVLLNVVDAGAVRSGFATLMNRARSARPDAKLDGVLVAPMMRGGVETIIGTLTDPVFGPMVMFGLGGVAVELFRDVAFASAPLMPERAERLIDASRGATLLKGWRGGPSLDRAALVDALCALSRFAAAHRGEIDSVEVNPFLVRESGACALDALIAFKPGHGTGKPT
ncbi:acetate--CoA ligase family protein [Roseomonas terrae]|jgi:acyl-CoA synthetase (NDP forming)|uniref:Acetate--CoA ligase family protein n=1 Tax=Neoroseomonas terrae TaxID=424799 RepID=A0ABS5EGH6_9PROT|nr:acetate--CoA ligase family protein [Neoroseomonas terrae]MBR0650126.1 acetate--CoA ligase family protein [Neoroseomonas terrae]